MTPRVTVLTTVYNGLPHLREAIESALNQTYRDFEYLIIDDASTDASVECILTYDDPRIRLVRNEKNLGTANTINEGLALITTPYVIRLDHDDVSLPNRIEEQIDYLDKHPDIAIVCSWEHTIDADGTRLRSWKRTIDNYGEFLAPILLGLCPIWHPSIAFRKDAMVAAGGFDAAYTRAEDFDVTARMALARLGAAVVPRFHLLARVHASQQSNRYDKLQAAVTRRVHTEALQRFSSSPYLENLGYFLRLEQDPTEFRKRKDYLRIIQGTLSELIQAVAEKQRLSAEESASLKKLIYRRVGPGIRFASVLSHLPSFAFYLSSPMHIPNMRSRLSKAYAKLHAFRYAYRRYE